MQASADLSTFCCMSSSETEFKALVGSIYGLTSKKLQQKVSQLILLGFGVPFNILKV